MRIWRAAVCATATVAAIGAAKADLVITDKPTSGMNCDAGVCTATAKNAALNVGDLQAMLAIGDVAVKTGTLTKDIEVYQRLTWSNASRLTLDAQRSIVVKKPVIVTGDGALTLTAKDGDSRGDYVFYGAGHIEFQDVASSLIIGGKSFTLVDDIASLANDISENTSGRYALARNYNAASDGTYRQAPVAYAFLGTFEGLGNRISRLSIDDTTRNHSVGLFAILESSGVLRDIGLSRVKIAAGDLSYVGGLVGQNLGRIQNSFVTGSITAGFGDGRTTDTGGLAGYSAGSIANSYSGVSLRVWAAQIVGGLTGENSGKISASYSTGSIGARKASYVGGLAGINLVSGIITHCHATGDVKAGNEAIAGAFLSRNFGSVSQSYALGSVTGGAGATTAGFIAFNASGAAIAQSYSRGDAFGASGDRYFDDVGGFVGYNQGIIVQSYSTGAPSTADRGKLYVGGLLGYDDATAGSLANTYWDLDTSGIRNRGRGAGRPRNDPGITGLTSSEFTSALPAGFDPKTWGQSPDVNNGYPYLLANPPQ